MTTVIAIGSIPSKDVNMPPWDDSYVSRLAAAYKASPNPLGIANAALKSLGIFRRPSTVKACTLALAMLLQDARVMKSIESGDDIPSDIKGAVVGMIDGSLRTFEAAQFLEILLADLKKHLAVA